MIELSNFPIYLLCAAIMLLMFSLLIYLQLLGTSSLLDWPLFEIIARKKDTDKRNWIEVLQIYWKEILALSLFFNSVILIDIATILLIYSVWLLNTFLSSVTIINSIILIIVIWVKFIKPNE